MENKSSSLVSVCLITYNHAKYIKEAIESVLIQNVNFEWELIIADDFSTDGTREIILDYKNRFPNIIKLILQPSNVGPQKNWLSLLAAADSKYIAYFEGDDYWIDSNKLQRQVDFLEKNSNYVACFTNAQIHFSSNRKNESYLKYTNDRSFNSYDIINGGGALFPSASLVYRNIIKDFPSFFYDAKSGDRALALMLLTFGDFYVLNFDSCVYRKHDNGIFTSIINEPLKRFEIDTNNIALLKAFNIYTKKKYQLAINKTISSIAKNSLIRLYKSKNNSQKKKLYKFLIFSDWLSLIYNLLKK